MLSPSVSTSATSTPSWAVPLIRPIAVSGCTARILGFHPTVDLLHQPRPRGDQAKRLHKRLQVSTYKSEFLHTLASRGFIHQVSEPEALDAKAAAGTIVAYVGFDATAPSLHIGNLLTIMMLRWLQKTGHRPIALMGGGTSKLGDPSGKDASRTLLTAEQIDANIASIRTVFSRFLDFDAGA